MLSDKRSFGAFVNRFLLTVFIFCLTAGCTEARRQGPAEAGSENIETRKIEVNLEAAPGGPDSQGQANPVVAQGTPRSDTEVVAVMKGQVREDLPPDEAFADAYKLILNGKFKDAAKVIENAKASTDKLESLSRIITQYEKIETGRKQSKKDTFAEKLEKYNEIQAKGVPEDVNGLDKAFAALIAARRYAEEEEKDKLLESAFVSGLVQKAKEIAADYEQQGKWIDAYAHGYYWLKAIYSKNEEYKKKAEQLTDMAIIQVSLSDNSCDTSDERHEGIEPEMFLRAIKALDFNYVSVIDYDEMAEKGFERCRLLGRVLKHSEEVAYEVEPVNVAKWQSGIDELEKKRLGKYVVVTRDTFMKLFLEILQLNEQTLGIDQGVVVAQYSEAVMSVLDPHTSLVWPWEVRDFQKNITQEFTGIGIEISKATGELKVVSLLPDTPAYTSGLDAEDIIIAINGEKVDRDMSIQCAVNKITGPAGTDVTLTVRHEDTGDIEDIVITRAKIIVPTIKGWKRVDTGTWKYIVDPEDMIGYVRISNFTGTTASDLDAVLKELEAKGMKGLVLDLRYNTGGLLTSAADVTDLFIEEGLIVKSQPRWGVSTYEAATKSGTHPPLPMAVLINDVSASASEIVAGALQDQNYRRATLVGQRTYGKGSVQTITPYTQGGSQLKYTMAFYHLPSDQRVESRYLMEKQGREDWGIAPDVKVKLTGTEEKEMLEIQRANEILAKADHDYEGKPIERHSLEETIKSDPQLGVGLLVVKAKLLSQGSEAKLLAGESASK